MVEVAVGLPLLRATWDEAVLDEGRIAVEEVMHGLLKGVEVTNVQCTWMVAAVAEAKQRKTR